jgi:hypothetical protein
VERVNGKGRDAMDKQARDDKGLVVRGKGKGNKGKGKGCKEQSTKGQLKQGKRGT